MVTYIALFEFITILCAVIDIPIKLSKKKSNRLS